MELGLAAKHPEVLAIFLTDGIMSEVEDETPENQAGTGDAPKNYAWRDETLFDLLELLDEAYIQLAPTTRAKKERKTKVAKLNGPKRKEGMPPNLAAEPEIPSGIPNNWVIPSALTLLSELEKKKLNLKNPIDLTPARNFVASQLQRPQSTQPHRPHQPPSASTSTQQH